MLTSWLGDWTKMRRSFVLALRSLWLHKLRSFLSVLGIIIGTAAVIALMAFGEGSMQDTLDDIRRQGATNVIVRSVKPADDAAGRNARSWVANYGLTFRDYDRFATIDDITRLVPMRIFPQELRRLDRGFNGRVVATTPSYAEIHHLTLAAGRFLIDEDDHLRRDVIVLGAGVADALFPFTDPLDQQIVLRGQDYRVVGVLRERAVQSGSSGSGGAASSEDYNNDVYLPFETCRIRFGQTIFIRSAGSRSGEQVEISQITLTVSDVDKVRSTGQLVRDILDARPQKKKDTVVTVPLDRLEEAERAKDRFTRLLVVIAGISLLVGGIGIMNIMLATVTERTREIGIRRALGAKRRDITLQFLVEAVVQTSVGGFVGVALGLAAVFLAPPIYHWFSGSNLPAKIHVASIFLSLGVSIGVGVLFGWYPAQRAAKLDPIEALRHE
jgi:putative ABC transport system permease protein